MRNSEQLVSLRSFINFSLLLTALGLELIDFNQVDYARLTFDHYSSVSAIQGPWDTQRTIIEQTSCGHARRPELLPRSSLVT